LSTISTYFTFSNVGYEIDSYINISVVNDFNHIERFIFGKKLSKMEASICSEKIIYMSSSGLGVHCWNIPAAMVTISKDRIYETMASNYNIAQKDLFCAYIIRNVSKINLYLSCQNSSEIM
jgi:hypothetical protein